MKAGDKVAVKWDDGSKSDGVTLVDHTDDFKNATIRTKHGGLMNGMVKSIDESQEMKQHE